MTDADLTVEARRNIGQVYGYVAVKITDLKNPPPQRGRLVAQHIDAAWREVRERLVFEPNEVRNPRCEVSRWLAVYRVFVYNLNVMTEYQAASVAVELDGDTKHIKWVRHPAPGDLLDLDPELHDALNPD